MNFTKTLTMWWLLCSLFCLPPCAANIAAQRRSASLTTSLLEKRALIISLDGLDARYLAEPDKYNLRILTPRRLMREGVTAARGIIAVYPTVTYPNHTTMITGALPARHGIFGNDVFEPPDWIQTRSGHWFAGDIKAQTLWDAARVKGLKVGLVACRGRRGRLQRAGNLATRRNLARNSAANGG